MLGFIYVMQACAVLNRPVAYIPQRASPISHNAPFCNRNVHTCAHLCYKMVYCGLFACIGLFVRSKCHQFRMEIAAPPPQSVGPAFGCVLGFGCWVSCSILKIIILSIQYVYNTVSAFIDLPGMFLPIDILCEEWINLVTTDDHYIKFTF